MRCPCVNACQRQGRTCAAHAVCAADPGPTPTHLREEAHHTPLLPYNPQHRLELRQLAVRLASAAAQPSKLQQRGSDGAGQHTLSRQLCRPPLCSTHLLGCRCASMQSQTLLVWGTVARPQRGWHRRGMRGRAHTAPLLRGRACCV